MPSFIDLGPLRGVAQATRLGHAKPRSAENGHQWKIGGLLVLNVGNEGMIHNHYQ